MGSAPYICMSLLHLREPTACAWALCTRPLHACGKPALCMHVQIGQPSEKGGMKQMQRVLCCTAPETFPPIAPSSWTIHCS